MTTEKKGMSGEALYKIFIYVVLITLAVVIIVPVAWVFLASVKQNSEFYGNPWALPASFYWQNFVDAWNSASMGSYMLNSVLVTALSLVLLLVIALPAAYCLARFQFRGSRFLNTCFMAGLFINVNYIVVPIFLMLRDGDAWLKNLIGNGFLLNNLVVLAVVYASTALPFTIYLLSGYFATLPHDFEEAAYIDGAGYGQAMIRIIFPMAHHHHYSLQFPLLLERVHHLYDADEQRSGPEDPPGGIAELDAGAAVFSGVRYSLRRPGAGDAAYADSLHVRAEETDPGYDRGRFERLR
jgi:N-acetylglucosamine transport system permease protein